ncbi:MAG: lipoate--protein ligase family protein [Lentisphaeria bacterium]|jgi:lipoate-protein ligase A
MLVLDCPATDPFVNLAREEILFTRIPDQEEMLFLLWRNAPCVVVGRFQNPLAEANREFVRARGLPVVRRLSGGGAVYHDLGNLNFTFILRHAPHRRIAYRPYLEPLARALGHLGVAAGFNTRNDLVIGGRKISGNAQHHSQGRVLHHGTLLFNTDLDALALALEPGADRIESKAVASVRGRVTNIAEHLPAPLTIEEFQEAILEQMRREGHPLRRRPLAAEEHAAAEELARAKYRTWEWTYAQSPPFTLRRQRRRADGTGIELELAVRDGCIASLALCRTGADAAPAAAPEGDAAFARRLCGCRFEPTALAARLAALPPAELPAGTDPGTLLALLRP